MPAFCGFAATAIYRKDTLVSRERRRIGAAPADRRIDWMSEHHSLPAVATVMGSKF
jgi:hypothetical protein